MLQRFTPSSSRSLDGARPLGPIAVGGRPRVHARGLRIDSGRGEGGRRPARATGATGAAVSAHIPPSPRDAPPSDEQLLGGVATDPSALGQLYDRYAKLVYGLALAILGSREEAQDLTQEVFVSVCEATAYDPARGSVSAFLATMARSRAIDGLRRRDRSTRLLETWHEAAAPTPAPTPPCEHVAMRRTVQRVRAALAELPWVQRQIVELAYYRGFSQREIAADLDTPLGTVKSRSRRALLTLGRALQDLTA